MNRRWQKCMIYYAAALYGVILRIVKHEMIAEEVMQACFIQAWRSIALYDSTKGQLFTWLVAIARRLAIDKIQTPSYRQRQLNQNLEILQDNSRFESSTFEPGYLQIKELTSTLSANQRCVIDLLYFEGYSQVEAAKVLKIPLGTVKTRVRQALQLLRKLIIKPPGLAA